MAAIVYLPALLAMTIVGRMLAERKHPAAPYVLWAALIFAISGTFRILRFATHTGSKDARSAPIWSGHLLNGFALFRLLRASLEVGRANRGSAPALPKGGQLPRDEARKE